MGHGSWVGAAGTGAERVLSEGQKACGQAAPCVSHFAVHLQQQLAPSLAPTHPTHPPARLYLARSPHAGDDADQRGDGQVGAVGRVLLMSDGALRLVAGQQPGAHAPHARRRRQLGRVPPAPAAPG